MVAVPLLLGARIYTSKKSGQPTVRVPSLLVVTPYVKPCDEVDTVSALAVFVSVFNPYMPAPNAINDNAKPAVPRINLFFLFMFYFFSYNIV